MQTNLKSEHEIYFPWQDIQWGRLISQMNSERLPHALSLIGPSCIGKQKFAVSFANFILCSSPLNKAPCGKCKSCCLSRSGNHPDCVIIKPDSKGKNINVDSIRDLDAFFSQTSQQRGWKIVIISPAESMNTNAANALLKTLEEPKEKTLIKKAKKDSYYGTDEGSLIEYLGAQVKIVSGSELNIKITRKEDLLLAESLLSRIK